jgi:hypothetical protein
MGDMQIVVRLLSGLGNQLFQYAAGRHLAKKFGASLRTMHEVTHDQATEGVLRPVMLQKFAITAPVGPLNRFDRLVLSGNPRHALASRLLRKTARVQIIREAPDAFLFHHAFPIIKGTRVVYLIGYWQAYSIVASVEAELREEFRLRERPGESSRRMAERIAAAPMPVSIHIRRGDYLTVFGEHAMLSSKYYEAAMARMRTQFPNCSFFIFTDDVAHAREWVADKAGCIIVDHNDALTAHEDIWLMASCRHHIIANSTFSWWGAWLNPRPDKCVTAPSEWLGFATAETHIASPDWALI